MGCPPVIKISKLRSSVTDVQWIWLSTPKLTDWSGSLLLCWQAWGKNGSNDIWHKHWPQQTNVFFSNYKINAMALFLDLRSLGDLVIGASLSEAHTNRSALQRRACMSIICYLQPCTYGKFWMNTFKYFTWIEHLRPCVSWAEKQWRATVRVQHQRERWRSRKAKHAWQPTFGLCNMTCQGRLLTDRKLTHSWLLQE